MLTFDEVRNDLKSLRHIEYSIQATQEASTRLKRQLEICKQSKFISPDELHKLKNSIEKLDSNEFIKQSIEKKEKYFEAISHLEEPNKTIIVDLIINGTKYKEIALKLHFSIECIKKRSNKAINDIKTYINKKYSNL